jgi:hypothetical protein
MLQIMPLFNGNLPCFMSLFFACVRVCSTQHTASHSTDKNDIAFVMNCSVYMNSMQFKIKLDTSSDHIMVGLAEIALLAGNLFLMVPHFKIKLNVFIIHN